MFRRFILFAAGFAAASGVERPAMRAAPHENGLGVRSQLNGVEFKEGYANLVQMGADAFPILLDILEDKACTDREKRRIFAVIAAVKADRSRFLEIAVQNLTDEDGGVRSSAVKLLSQIGTEKDTAPVVALLSDGHTVASHTVPYAAAKALAAIGGPREVVAMDAWLLGGSHADDKPLREHVKNCRDELAGRLAKEPKKK